MEEQNRYPKIKIISLVIISLVVSAEFYFIGLQLASLYFEQKIFSIINESSKQQELKVISPPSHIGIFGYITKKGEQLITRALKKQDPSINPQNIIENGTTRNIKDAISESANIGDTIVIGNEEIKNVIEKIGQENYLLVHQTNTDSAVNIFQTNLKSVDGMIAYTAQVLSPERMAEVIQRIDKGQAFRGADSAVIMAVPKSDIAEKYAKSGDSIGYFNEIEKNVNPSGGIKDKIAGITPWGPQGELTEVVPNDFIYGYYSDGKLIKNTNFSEKIFNSEGKLIPKVNELSLDKETKIQSVTPSFLGATANSTTSLIENLGKFFLATAKVLVKNEAEGTAEEKTVLKVVPVVDENGVVQLNSKDVKSITTEILKMKDRIGEFAKALDDLAGEKNVEVVAGPTNKNKIREVIDQKEKPIEDMGITPTKEGQSIMTGVEKTKSEVYPTIKPTLKEREQIADGVSKLTDNLLKNTLSRSNENGEIEGALFGSFSQANVVRADFFQNYDANGKKIGELFPVTPEMKDAALKGLRLGGDINAINVNGTRKANIDGPQLFEGKSYFPTNKTGLTDEELGKIFRKDAFTGEENATTIVTNKHGNLSTYLDGKNIEINIVDLPSLDGNKLSLRYLKLLKKLPDGSVQEIANIIHPEDQLAIRLAWMIKGGTGFLAEGTDEIIPIKAGKLNFNIETNFNQALAIGSTKESIANKTAKVIEAMINDGSIVNVNANKNTQKILDSSSISPKTKELIKEMLTRNPDIFSDSTVRNNSEVKTVLAVAPIGTFLDNLFEGEIRNDLTDNNIQPQNSATPESPKNKNSLPSDNPAGVSGLSEINEKILEKLKEEIKKYQEELKKQIPDSDKGYFENMTEGPGSNYPTEKMRYKELIDKYRNAGKIGAKLSAKNFFENATTGTWQEWTASILSFLAGLGVGGVSAGVNPVAGTIAGFVVEEGVRKIALDALDKEAIERQKYHTENNTPTYQALNEEYQRLLEFNKKLLNHNLGKAPLDKENLEKLNGDIINSRKNIQSNETKMRNEPPANPTPQVNPPSSGKAEAPNTESTGQTTSPFPTKGKGPYDFDPNATPPPKNNPDSSPSPQNQPNPTSQTPPISEAPAPQNSSPNQPPTTRESSPPPPADIPPQQQSSSIQNPNQPPPVAQSPDTPPADLPPTAPAPPPQSGPAPSGQGAEGVPAAPKSPPASDLPPVDDDPLSSLSDYNPPSPTGQFPQGETVATSSGPNNAPQPSQSPNTTNSQLDHPSYSSYAPPPSDSGNSDTTSAPSHMGPQPGETVVQASLVDKPVTSAPVPDSSFYKDTLPGSGPVTSSGAPGTEYKGPQKIDASGYPGIEESPFAKKLEGGMLETIKNSYESAKEVLYNDFKEAGKAINRELSAIKASIDNTFKPNETVRFDPMKENLDEAAKRAQEEYPGRNVDLEPTINYEQGTLLNPNYDPRSPSDIANGISREDAVAGKISEYYDRTGEAENLGTAQENMRNATGDDFWKNYPVQNSPEGGEILSTSGPAPENNGAPPLPPNPFEGGSSNSSTGSGSSNGPSMDGFEASVSEFLLSGLLPQPKGEKDKEGGGEGGNDLPPKEQDTGAGKEKEDKATK